eukprot:1337481-Amorphochlora_amoeboformis.AAC.1
MSRSIVTVHPDKAMPTRRKKRKKPSPPPASTESKLEHLPEGLLEWAEVPFKEGLTEEVRGSEGEEETAERLPALGLGYSLGIKASVHVTQVPYEASKGEIVELFESCSKLG